MSKYPELQNKNKWTQRMVYIHRRALIIGLILGFIEGVMVAGLIWAVASL